MDRRVLQRDGEGGHAVTPFAVRDDGDGTYEILVYDNNHPGLTRSIAVNRAADTWTYNASTNPSDPESKYDGDATTKSLMLFPTSPGLPPQPSAYADRDVPKPGSVGALVAPAHGVATEVFLDAAVDSGAHLLITDDAGHQTGYLDGGQVNQIPGAVIQEQLLDDPQENAEPDYTIPSGVHFTVTLDGTGEQAREAAGVDIIGDAYDLAVQGIRLAPGTQQTVTPAVDGSTLAYTSPDAQSPTLSLGASYPASFYTFTVDASTTGPGTVTADLPLDTGQFSVNESSSGSDSSLTASVERADANSLRTELLPGTALRLARRRFSTTAVGIAVGRWGRSSSLGERGWAVATKNPTAAPVSPVGEKKATAGPAIDRPAARPTRR